MSELTIRLAELWFMHESNTARDSIGGGSRGSTDDTSQWIYEILDKV